MSDNDQPAGIGFAQAHHGEILQGVFHDNTGQLTKALVTLQYSARESRATFYLQRPSTDVACPPKMSKAYRAATLSMAQFATERSPVTDGRIEISSTVPHGIGMGSSTADVTAVIRAIADFHRATPSWEEVGRIAIQAECASDPTMIDDRVVLFAQREGVVLETLGHMLPGMIVVGCEADPGTGGIDTLALPPAMYSAADIEAFSVLRAELRVAVATGDVAGIGRVATASALISQRFLPKSALGSLLDICRSCGGCGVQVAHSGTVAGVIFDPRRHGVMNGVERCVDRIAKAGLPRTGVIESIRASSAGVERSTVSLTSVFSFTKGTPMVSQAP